MRFTVPAVAMYLMLIVARDACAQKQYYLPQVANGSFGGVSFRTTFILFNNSDVAVTAIMKLTDDAANPLTMTIGGLGTGSQFTISLDAGATAFPQTDGQGSGTVGAAAVTATGNIGVSAIFTVYDANGKYMTEAGVGSADPSTEFVLPVDVTGPYNTGLAMLNTGSASAAITAILVGTDGKESQRTTRSLSANGHLAIFTTGSNQLFPSLGNFQGTLVVQSSMPVAALVLRQYQSSSKTSYTSLPAVPRSSTKLTMNLAQVANGSYGGISFKTSFLIFNISSSAANVALALTKDDGSPFSVRIPGSGPGTGTNSSFDFALAAGASIFLQTDGLGAGTSGAATITSNVPVGASALFTVLDSQGQFQTEAGVGDAPPLSASTIPVDVTGNYDTGVAFFNPGNSNIALTLKLLDTNGILGLTQTRSLPPKNHFATFVDNLFPGVSNFRGSLAVSAPGGVAATTLRQYASGATYTTLPTASGAAAGKAQVVPLLTTTVTDVTAMTNDPDVSISVSLLPGSLLSGTISGAGQGMLVMASAGGNRVYWSQVNPWTGKYLSVVPDGTYSLAVCYQPSGVPGAAGLTLTYTDPTPVQVVFDGVRDISLPAVALLDVSGTVSALNSLPFPADAIVFTSNDNKIQGRFTLDASGKYRGVLPAGDYLASVGGGSSQLYNVGALAVKGGPAVGNYAAPATAMLSGSVSGGGFPSMPPGTSVTATDTSAPAAAQLACCSPTSTTSASVGPSGQYQMALAQNRRYGVGVTIPVSGLGVVSYPLSVGAVSISGDTTFDITIPRLPAKAIIFGNVKDSVGNAVANVVVSASSTTISDVTNVGFSAGAMTDIYGNYSMVVLSGTKYQVSFVPPAPKP